MIPRTRRLRTRHWFLAIATAVIAILAAACGGSSPSSDRELGDVLVLTPTPATVTCLDDTYPDDAPAFGDDGAVAYTTLESGVAIFDHLIGDGPQPDSDSEIRVHYTGFFDDGCIFDTSRTRDAPSLFRLDNLISGWQDGMADMREGGKRRIRIPPALGYGPAGLNLQGFVIPGNATLIFEVELVEVVEPDAS
ncbi:MAG: FKBP-type peptidyl-prolyl cis-trans isomerase [Chloroflexi bacterium]|nr:FKBP-type peptidyl-prolyl cis-trans isomerase [Chloroflexota bacterium]